MIPFNNPFNPFGLPFMGMPPFVPFIPKRRSCLKRLDIFELPTNAVSLSDTSVDYGIDPVIYRQLPCECYVTVKIRQAVPTGGAGLPVTIVTPTGSSRSTVVNSGSTSGTKKSPVVDHNNNPVVGSDVSEFTDALALLNKSLGIFKFVNFVSGGAPAANTPAESSVSKSK